MRRSFGVATARWQAGDTRASPAFSKESFSKSARPRWLISPQRPLSQLAPGSAGLRRRQHSYSSDRGSRALPGFKKSRSLTERSLGAAVPRSQVMNSPPGATALRRLWAAPIPQWRRAAGGGRPNSDVCPLLRCEGEGDARQPRLALAQVQQPVLAKLSAGLSSRRCLLFFTVAAAAYGAGWVCKSSFRDPGPQVPGPQGRESCLLLLLPLADFPARTVAALGGCQQCPDSGALLPGAAGKGDLQALPKTPARAPQALALGCW